MSWSTRVGSRPRLLHTFPTSGSSLQVSARRLSHVTAKSKPNSTGDIHNLRNLAIVAHIDSGKTTLTESILARSGYLEEPGTVDTGSTTTDFLPAERERGITIQSASIPVSWKHWTINLVDTPGHADFGMEVESASRVVDGAIVLIDAVEGVESQTQGVWHQLDRYGVPSRMLFVNKMDRPGASLRASIQSLLKYRLHPKPMTITLPIASFDPRIYGSAEPGIEGLVDLVRWELWKWGRHDSQTDDWEPIMRVPLPRDVDTLEKANLFPISHPLLKELVDARLAMLESLSMFSEELMDQLLSLGPEASAHLEIRDDSIMPALRAATLRKDILPVLCGSAMNHIATDLVLDYAGLLLACPLDNPVTVSPEGMQNLQLLAWKVVWDSRRGWMTYIRVYSGILTRQTSLFNMTRNEKEKASKLMLLYASQPEEVELLHFGSIGVVLGLKHTRTGDTLVSADWSVGARRSKGKEKDRPMLSVLRDITPPSAVMSASIIPQTQADLEPIQNALYALVRTDPSARVEVSEGQLLLHGLGALHLEILENRLREEWGMKFESGPRRVTYREGFRIGNEDVVEDSWSTEVQGRRVEARLAIKMRALEDADTGDPLWDDNIVLGADEQPLCALTSEKVSGSQYQHDPWAQISLGIASALLSSPNSMLPLSRTRIQVMKFILNPENGPPSVLAGAVSFIIRRILKRNSTGSILEPYVRLKVCVTDECYGRIIKDLTEHRGELTGSTEPGCTAYGEDVSPYTEEGIYLPPSWVSPSAVLASDYGRAGSRMRRTIHAIAPLSGMLDYNSRLRALSGGHGTFEVLNAGYRIVGESRKLEILRELGRAS